MPVVKRRPLDIKSSEYTHGVVSDNPRLVRCRLEPSRALRFGNSRKNAQTALRQLNKKLPPLPPSVLDQPLLTVPASIQKEVQKALRGQKYHSVAIDLWFLTLFQQKVLKATCQIPWGEVRTYGWVAQKAGSPEGGRAAGQALNKSPISLLVPCHRVIASGHHLGGYGGDLTWKISLLKAEKVQLLRLSDGSYKVGWV